MNTLLRTLLYEWRDRTLPSVIERDTKLETTPRQGKNNATVITGFRRVGKTYLLYEAISTSKQCPNRLYGGKVEIREPMNMLQ